MKNFACFLGYVVLCFVAAIAGSGQLMHVGLRNT